MNRKQRRYKNKMNNKKNAVVFIRNMCVVLSIISLIIYYGLYKLNTMLENDALSNIYSNDTIQSTKLITKVKKKEQISILFAGTDESNLRTDSIMYIKYNTINNKLYIMSIPRDTYTTNKYANKKINNIYFGGKHIDSLVEEVERMLNVEIDYYCVMKLDLISEIIEKINGLDIEIEEEVWKKNKKTGKWYLFLEAGRHTLNAKQVEKLVRNRDYKDGDIQREKVQRQVLIQLFENILKTENIFKIPSIANIIVANTDTNITTREALQYISEINEINLKDVVSTLTPWEYYDLNGISYIKVDDKKAQEAVKSWDEN